VEVFEKPPAQAAQAAAAEAAARTEDGAEGEPARARAPLLETDGGRRVLVLGAGKRVHTDVLPALAALAGRYALAGLYARSDRVLTVGGTLRSTVLRPPGPARRRPAPRATLARHLIPIAALLERVTPCRGALARVVQHADLFRLRSTCYNRHAAVLHLYKPRRATLMCAVGPCRRGCVGRGRTARRLALDRDVRAREQRGAVSAELARAARSTARAGTTNAWR
jgi:hypothetical protein